MAGAGYKLFNTGDVLTAAQVNTYLQEQAVMRFANSTARTTALSGVLAEGMVSYLDDTNAVEVYNGSAWVGVSGTGDVTEVQAGTGISVASGTGPIPVVTNTMATAIDAKGDLIVGTGADTFSRLAVGGTNGHVLKVNSSTSTGLEWGAASSAATFVGVSAFKSSATSLTADNVVILDLPSESWDTDGFHSTSTNNSRITIPSGKAGKYLLIMQITTQTAGTIIGYFYKNGGNVPEIGTGNNTIFRNSNTGSGTTGWTGSIVVDAAVGDYFEAAAYSAGTTKNTDGQTFQAIYLGA